MSDESQRRWNAQTKKRRRPTFNAWQPARFINSQFKTINFDSELTKRVRVSADNLQLVFWDEATWEESHVINAIDYIVDENVARSSHFIVDLNIADEQRKRGHKDSPLLISLPHHGATVRGESVLPEPPANAEYLLHLLLPSEDRDALIGDLIESYGQLFQRFNKRRADIWFYKQVIESLWPLLKRAALKLGALVWLGRMLQRFIS